MYLTNCITTIRSVIYTLKLRQVGHSCVISAVLFNVASTGSCEVRYNMHSLIGTRGKPETGTWATVDNMAEDSGGVPARSEPRLGHHIANGWRQAEVEEFRHCPRRQGVGNRYHITI